MLAHGFHKLAHGHFEITVLSDGCITLPREILMPDGSAEERKKLLGRLGGNGGGAPAQTNIPLTRMHFRPTDGKRADNVVSGGSQAGGGDGCRDTDIRGMTWRAARTTKGVLFR